MTGEPGTRLLLKREPHRDPTMVTGDEPGLRRGGPRIRCPRCTWEPGRDDQWICLCGHVWNTFDTGGVCPACRRQWEHTQCLRCQEWSRHQDWYAREDDG
jgi:hypothetical protein